MVSEVDRPEHVQVCASDEGRDARTDNLRTSLTAAICRIMMMIIIIIYITLIIILLLTLSAVTPAQTMRARRGVQSVSALRGIHTATKRSALTTTINQPLEQQQQQLLLQALRLLLRQLARR